MTSHLAFTVPGEPFAKGRPKSSARIVFKNGKPLPIITVFTPAKTREGEARIKRIAQRYMDGRPPLDVPLILKVRTYFGIPESWPQWLKAEARAGNVMHTCKPDFDNLAKVIDALKDVCFTDDAIIIDATISKRCAEVARTEIIIQPVPMEGRFMWPGSLREGPKRPAPSVPALPGLFDRALGASDGAKGA